MQGYRSAFNSYYDDTVLFIEQENLEINLDTCSTEDYEKLLNLMRKKGRKRENTLVQSIRQKLQQLLPYVAPSNFFSASTTKREYFIVDAL